MEKKYPALIRLNVLSSIGLFRKYYFRFLGMQIGDNIILGKIRCEWPNKVSIGSGTKIEDQVFFKITRPFNQENNIIIGKNVFIGSSCEFNCNTHIVISDNCLIASNCTFVDTGHEINADTQINKQPITTAPIVLEEDVWVGTRCIILKGVTIGRGSVIGAGSTVNKSIPPNQIWAGCPARFIRYRKEN